MKPIEETHPSLIEEIWRISNTDKKEHQTFFKYDAIQEHTVDKEVLRETIAQIERDFYECGMHEQVETFLKRLRNNMGLDK